MTQIILDAKSLGTLSAVTQPVEICDPSGRVLGKFVPRLDSSEWEIIGAEPSAEELRQREQSSDRRYTTAEVIAHLESMQ